MRCREERVVVHAQALHCPYRDYTRAWVLTWLLSLAPTECVDMNVFRVTTNEVNAYDDQVLFLLMTTMCRRIKSLILKEKCLVPLSLCRANKPPKALSQRYQVIERCG